MSVVWLYLSCDCVWSVVVGLIHPELSHDTGYNQVSLPLFLKSIFVLIFNFVMIILSQF